MKNNETGGASNTYGGEDVLVGDLMEKCHLEDPGVGEKTISKLTFQKWHGET
jgi:hypothetical protein